VGETDVFWVKHHMLHIVGIVHGVHGSTIVPGISDKVGAFVDTPATPIANAVQQSQSTIVQVTE